MYIVLYIIIYIYICIIVYNIYCIPHKYRNPLATSLVNHTFCMLIGDICILLNVDHGFNGLAREINIILHTHRRAFHAIANQRRPQIQTYRVLYHLFDTHQMRLPLNLTRVVHFFFLIEKYHLKDDWEVLNTSRVRALDEQSAHRHGEFRLPIFLVTAFCCCT